MSTRRASRAPPGSGRAPVGPPESGRAESGPAESGVAGSSQAEPGPSACAPARPGPVPARPRRPGGPSPPGPGHGPVSHGGGAAAPALTSSPAHGGALPTLAGGWPPASPAGASSTLMESGSRPARPARRNHCAVSGSASLAVPAALRPGSNHGSGCSPSASAPARLPAVPVEGAAAGPDGPPPGARQRTSSITRPGSGLALIQTKIVGLCATNVWIFTNQPISIPAPATPPRLTGAPRRGPSAPRRSRAPRGRSDRRPPSARRSAAAGPGPG